MSGVNIDKLSIKCQCNIEQCFGAGGKGNTMSDKEKRQIGPVVSAAHLASGAMPAISEVEYALTLTTNAFQRWTVRCTAASGYPGLAAVDVQVLHSVHHRGREKSLADLCLVLNIEDTHLVNYALKKLEAMGLVFTGKRGKEKTAGITEKGIAACEKYHTIREALLIEGIKALGLDMKEISRAATLLRALSGQYDQAARSAASL
jgi:predicted MarR family transcription regulator